MLMDLVQRAFRDKFSSETLYHYTTRTVFDLFMRDDAKLYCTDVKRLNDSAEFKLGLDTGLKYLSRKYGEDHVIYKSICKTLESVDEQGLWHAWVMSFSSKGDLLSQWRGYVKGGGYSVGFSRETLDALVAQRTFQWHQQELKTGLPVPYVLYLFPCFYEKHDDIERLLDILFKDTVQGYLNATLHVKVDPVLKEIGTVLSLLYLFAGIYKQESFHEECETRLVMQNQTILSGNVVEEIGGKPRIAVPIFPELMKVRDAITLVTSSPHGGRDELFAHAEELRMSASARFSVARSSSTYVGD